jgi:hypothetical protein
LACQSLHFALQPVAAPFGRAFESTLLVLLALVATLRIPESGGGNGEDDRWSQAAALLVAVPAAVAAALIAWRKLAPKQLHDCGCLCRSDGGHERRRGLAIAASARRTRRARLVCYVGCIISMSQLCVI